MHKMMNLNEGDVDLGHAVSSTTYSIRGREIDSTGAGVNADSRMDRAFAASDSVVELVWSPRSGLGLKHANTRIAEKKPFLLWNVVGPSNKSPSTSQLIGHEGSRDVDQGNTAISGMLLHADDMFVDKDTFLRHKENCHVENNDKIEEKAEAKDANLEGENCSDDGKEDFCRPQSVQNAAPLINLEASHENDLRNLTEKDVCSLGGKKSPSRNSPPVEGSGTKSRISMYKKKGKKIAISDGDIHGRSVDDEDNIHESVESCNSAGLLSRGVKRWSCGEDVMHLSKRFKNEIPGLTCIPPDNSFVKWMSNMVKGFSNSNGEDASSIPLPLACSFGVNVQDPPSLNMGFQTVFQSLCSQDMNLLNTGVEKANDSIDESRDLMLDDKESLVSLFKDDKNDGSAKQIIVCDREVNPHSVVQPSNILAADIDCSPYPFNSNFKKNEAAEFRLPNRAKDEVMEVEALPEQMNKAAESISPEIPVATCEPDKGDFHNSLWIARFCTKNPSSEKCQDIIQGTIGCSTSRPKLDLDQNAVFSIDQKGPETRNEPGDSRVHATFKESLKSTSSVEVSFDLNSKGNLLSHRFGGSEAMSSVFARRLDALRHIVPSENNVMDFQRSHLFDIVSEQNSSSLSDVFHAVRSLRLCRADILRLINSNVSASKLCGFFLRLRLRKLEGGPDGASYCVACITGEARELKGCTSKKSILVDVGGIKSSITCQHVSNHDFLEDEIKAWWCSTIDRGCKIPSLDELNSIFNNRRSLGF